MSSTVCACVFVRECEGLRRFDLLRDSITFYVGYIGSLLGNDRGGGSEEKEEIRVLIRGRRSVEGVSHHKPLY